MSFIADAFQEIGATSWIDDHIDRMGRRYIVAIIGIQLTLIFGGEFIRGNQIQCFLPVYFTGAQEEYAESLCWTLSTEYIIEGNAEKDVGKLGFYNREISGRYETHETKYVGLNHPGQRVAVSYYQWTPLILVILAGLFHVPYIVWSSISKASGLPLKSIVSSAHEISGVQEDGSERDGIVNDIVYVITRYTEASHLDDKSSFKIGRSHGNVLFFSYMLVKVLYIVFLAIQLVVLQMFLGNDPRFNVLLHGAQVIDNLVRNGSWHQNPIFPIKTVCTFEAEQQGNPLPYTLECIIPVNLYNDKFFALFTIAFPVLIALVVISMVRWLFENSKVGRRAFVKAHLEVPLALDSSSSRDLSLFAEEYLRRDGLFCLTLMKMNVGRDVVETVLEKMWNQFQDELQETAKGDEVDSRAPKQKNSFLRRRHNHSD
jgi:hypothetical protein